MLKAAKPEKNEKTAAISPIFKDCQSALKITSDPSNVPDAIIVVQQLHGARRFAMMCSNMCSHCHT